MNVKTDEQNRISKMKNKYGLKLFENEDLVEVGLDECARGCLWGRVYTAACIWSNEYVPGSDEEKKYFDMIRDSKKLSKKQRENVLEFIEETALDFVVKYKESSEIDSINIYKACQSGFHDCLSDLSVEPDFIFVDGNTFDTYYMNDVKIPHKCVVKGDNTYINIASASIIAKVNHDRYIEESCDVDPELDSRYGLLSNMGYGTSIHIEGIRKYGHSHHHRKSFKVKSLGEECMFIDE